jgi:hypothetical protein
VEVVVVMLEVVVLVVFVLLRGGAGLLRELFRTLQG